VIECLLGLIEAQRRTHSSENFEEWIEATFGEGIARYFMLPYNFKVWAHPPAMMSKQWMAERVSVVDTERVLSNVILDRDDVSWGPNNRFKYPLDGGTGAIYHAFRPYIEQHLHLEHRVIDIDFDARRVEFANASSTEYDALISTLPLDQVIAHARGVPISIRNAATHLDHSSSYIVGIGVSRPCPSNKCWLYFPEDDSPFYRVTYLSNYSPLIAPSDQHFALLTETSYSRWKPVSKETILDRVVDGLVSTRLLEEDDRGRIVSRYLIDVEYSYPVPTLRRDDALATIQPWLMERDVYSRGRFGAWLYEIGNMDHSVMQGVEVVDSLLLDEKETTWTPSQPSAPVRSLNVA
jgi:protoporphyrinogen oxidase